MKKSLKREKGKGILIGFNMIVALIAGIITIITGTILILHKVGATCEWKIISPLSGNEIFESPITVKGISDNKLPKGKYLYSIHEDEGMWWPGIATIRYSKDKNRFECENKHWVGEPEENGEQIGLLLIIVDENIHNKFQAWHKDCEKKGDWTAGIEPGQVEKWGKMSNCDSIVINYKKK